MKEEEIVEAPATETTQETTEASAEEAPKTEEQPSA